MARSMPHPERPTASKAVVIIVHESVRESLARDLGTFCVFAAFMALGVLVGSEPMQWVGAGLASIAVLRATLGMSDRRTPQQARAKLDEIEGLKAPEARRDT